MLRWESPLVCGFFHLRRRQPLAQMNSNFCHKLWGKRAIRKTVPSGEMICMFQSREGSRTQIPPPLSPVLVTEDFNKYANWRFKQLPGLVKVKADLPRLRWDPKGQHLQRLLHNCVLLSPWRRQNLRKPCRSLQRSLILSLQEALHTKITFWHFALHVIVQMKPLILSVLYLISTLKSLSLSAF